ncbi:energy transducer TonB [Flavobacterium mesophilum]|uniref:energy transducer TonB n=1 Tax=Flavobacterium mesophilum TaxID=3143495 RepID=UPI0031D63CE2
MKFKLILTAVVALSLFSCKNETKGENGKVKPSKTEKESVLQDSTKTGVATVNLPEVDRTADTKLLHDFFIKNDKKPQFFTINNLKDTAIVCAEKTKITIRANSFIISNSKNAVTGKIKISVKEYYSISDILLGRLSTTSNGKLLETGGMLEINAFSNNEKCELKSGKAIEIAFPRKKEKDGMQLFSGSWKNNQINWEVAENSVNLNQIYTKVDEPPVFPGGINKFYKLLGSYIRQPEESISGRVYTSFIVDKEGNITNVTITKGLTIDINTAVVDAFKKIPKFIPGKVNGVPVNTTYHLPITIKSEDELPSQKLTYTNEFRTTKDYNEKAILEEKTAIIDYYLFSSVRMGMINCDRFFNISENLKTNFAINFDNNSETTVSIVFHDIKSIMTANTSANEVTFKNIPLERKITIIAIKYFDGKPFIATKETTTSTMSEKNLAFKPISLEGLKSEIEKLNRFN